MSIKFPLAYKNLDPNNITGHKLAEIGRAVLKGELLEQFSDEKLQAKIDTIDYKSLKWLDNRIKEICERGRL
jgi:hypothetical protein